MRFEPKPLKERPRKISDYNKTPINHNKKRIVSEEEIIEAIWTTWCKFTKRPEEHSVLTDDISKSISECLYGLKNQSISIYTYFTRAASFLNPRNGDQDDIKRLLDCLVNKSTRKSAVQKMTVTAPRPFYWSKQEDRDSRIDEVVELLKWRSYADSSDKDQSVLVTLANLSEDDFNILLKKARVMYGDDASISPSDVLNINKRDKRLKRTNTGQGSSEKAYQAGRKEDDALFGDDTVEYDKYAMDLVMNGYDWDSVLEYHKSMPKGYWHEVSRIVESTEQFDMEDIYEGLVKKYRMHPSERHKPDLV